MSMTMEFETDEVGRHELTGMAEFRRIAEEAQGLRIHLLRDGETVCTWSPRFFPEESDLLEWAFSSEEPERGHTVQSKYKEGDCEVFAVALLSEIGEGQLVAVWEPSPDEDDVLAAPYLAHAGVLLDGMVYDVDGGTDYEEWVSDWVERTSVPDDADWGAVTQEFLEDMQAEPISAEALQKAKGYAALLVRVYADDLPIPSVSSVPA